MKMTLAGFPTVAVGAQKKATKEKREYVALVK